MFLRQEKTNNARQPSLKLALATIGSLVILFSSIRIAHGAALNIQKLLFANTINGLGQYEPRENNKVPTNEAGHIYLEVAGFQTLADQNNEGQYEVDVAVDIVIRLPQSRRRLAEQASLQTLKTTLKTNITTHFFPINVSFADWDLGDYLLEVGVRDNLGGQTVSQDILFTVLPAVSMDVTPATK